MKTVRDTEPICPYCGTIPSDWAMDLPSPFELAERGTLFECGECEREYYVTCHVVVTYTTEAIDDS